MKTIEWTRYLDDGEEAVYDLPARWEICSTCDGEGRESAYLGAITQEDRDRDWSHDEWEDYMQGGYDRPCAACNATGKILRVDLERLKFQDKALYAAYCEYLQDEADYQQMCRMERMLGC
jgi:hypothetical protein